MRGEQSIMHKKLIFLVALASIACIPSALATDYVSESNLTGIKLPQGALELTDDDFSEEMVELLEDTAASMNGKCQYHELLFWEGNPVAITNALNAKIPASLKYKNIDADELDDGAYETFSLTSTNARYAGVWIQGAKDITLAWCDVVKK